MVDANTRPKFYVPFPAGTHVTAKSYVGHNPDHMKMDIYAQNWPGVVASAPGLVHEHFDPGGIEIRHFIPGTKTLGNWYTTYLHMSARADVGTVVTQGQWVGTAGSVGTGVKHLHHEQLHDRTPDGDADTGDMVYPAFQEHNGGEPFSMPLGEPGVSMVSENHHELTISTRPINTDTTKMWQGADVPDILRRGEYLGLITGPKESHGGANPTEQAIVKKLQQRLIVCGFVTDIHNPNNPWADGRFGVSTRNAVIRFQRKYETADITTNREGRVYTLEWAKLFNI